MEVAFVRVSFLTSLAGRTAGVRTGKCMRESRSGRVLRMGPPAPGRTIETRGTARCSGEDMSESESSGL